MVLQNKGGQAEVVITQKNKRIPIDLASKVIKTIGKVLNICQEILLMIAKAIITSRFNSKIQQGKLDSISKI